MSTSSELNESYEDEEIDSTISETMNGDADQEVLPEFVYENLIFSNVNNVIRTRCMGQMDLMYRRLEGELTPNVLHTGPVSILLPNDHMIFDEYEVEVINTDQSVKITFPHTNINLGIEKGIYHLSASEFKTLAHEFTFSCLCLQTDEPLRDHFPEIDVSTDMMTPDQILDYPNCLHVTEFTTTMSDSEEQARMAFERKIYKYNDVISARISYQREKELKYSLNSIVTCVGAVWSNLTIPQSVVNLLASRMTLIRAMMELARSQGYVAPDTADVGTGSLAYQILRSIEPIYDDENDMRGLVERKFTERALKAENRDYLFVKKLYKQAVDNAGLRFDVDYEDPELVSYKLENYILNHQSGRANPKAVVPFPFILPNGKDFSECPKKGLPEKSSGCGLMTKIWNQVIDKIDKGEVDLRIFDTEFHTSVALMSDDDPYFEHCKANRKNYHRITLDLDDDEKEELAKVGVLGKKLKGLDAVKAHQKTKKMPFCYNTTTEDIEEAIMSESHSLYSKSIEGENKSLDVCMRLIDKALSFHKNFNLTYKNFLPFLKTSFFRYNSLISDIAIEVCISLKQFTKGYTCIVKRLKEHNVWLLIKPTTPTGHIYVSLLYPKDYSTIVSSNTMFKKFETHSEYYCTEFTSFNVSKLVNLCKAESMSIGLMIQWYRFYNLDPLSWSTSEEFWRMLTLSCVIGLEDKHQTEEVFTIFRYISMEKFKIPRAIPKPSKMIEKLPNVFRSRLQLWSTKKLMYEIQSPRYRLKRRNELEEDDYETGLPANFELLDEEGRDWGKVRKSRWTDLVNPYTRASLKTPDQLIELYYLGYAKNKEQPADPITELALIEKIVKVEDDMSTTDPRMFGDGNKLEPHKTLEFSSSCIRVMGDLFKKYALKNKALGPEGLSAVCVSALGRITWEELATLKASSTGEVKIDAEKGKVETKRTKVLIAIMQKINLLPTRPIEFLPTALEALENSGGIYATIFKKSQHGGLREIYVLDLMSRLVQKCVETISIQLSRIFSFETLTSPKNKTFLPQRHYGLVNSDTGAYKANLCSSNDAKSWNQGHHVTKFAMMLCSVLPIQFHGLIIRSMRLWRHKRIQLPDGVSRIILSHDNILFENEIINMVLQAYHGMIQKPWLRRGSLELHIESGMMQGILHYTSSFFHACFLHMRDFFFRMAASVFKKRFTIYTQDLVSSDDSSRISDVVSNETEGLKMGYKLLILDHMAIGELSNSVGIEMSPKSTQLTSNLMEFNSEFMIGPCIVKPTIKWVFSMLGMIEVESLMDRQQIWANQLTELLESGAPFIQVHVSQFAQALLHYKLLGSTVNPLFEVHLSNLSEVPDPALGFFLMDPPITAGLLGLNYNYWIAAQDTPLNNRMARQFLDRDLSLTSRGILSQGASIRYGNRQKWYKLMLAMEKMCPEWRTLIEQNPRVLYESAWSKTSLMLALLAKLSNPSVATSLSKGNSIGRMISSSVYMISRNSVSVGDIWRLTEDKDVKKSSLYKLGLQRSTHSLFLSREQMDTLFPNCSNYSQVRDVLNSFASSLSLSPLFDPRRIRSSLIVYPERLKTPFTLEELCKWKWFDHDIPAGDHQKNSVWEYFRNVFPWLRDDPHTSLIDSPFTTQVQLKNFVSKFTDHTRTVHIVGAPIASSTMHDQLVSTIKRNPWPYKQIMDTPLDRDTSYMRKMKHELYMVINYPLQKEAAKNVLTRVLSNYAPVWNGEDVHPDDRTAALSIMQSFARGNMDTERMYELITQAKLGVKGGFTIRQRFNPTIRDRKPYGGRGEWRGQIGSCHIKISIMDETMTGVTVDSIDRFKSSFSIFRTFYQEMTWKESTVEGRSALSIVGSRLTISNIGTKVHVLEELRSLVNSFRNPRIDCNKGAIRIVDSVETEVLQRGVMVRTMTPVTVLSCVLTMADYMFGHTSTITNGLGPLSENLGPWINSSSLDLNLVRVLLDSTRNRARYDQREISVWLHTLGHNSFKQAGVVFNQTSFETESLFRPIEVEPALSPELDLLDIMVGELGLGSASIFMDSLDPDSVTSAHSASLVREGMRRTAIEEADDEMDLLETNLEGYRLVDSSTIKIRLQKIESIHPYINAFVTYIRSTTRDDLLRECIVDTQVSDDDMRRLWVLTNCNFTRRETEFVADDEGWFQ